MQRPPLCQHKVRGRDARREAVIEEPGHAQGTVQSIPAERQRRRMPAQPAGMEHPIKLNAVERGLAQ